MLVSAAVCMMVPAIAQAQAGSIIATARVLPRPLSLVDASRTAVPGELRVRVDGCASGALTVDARGDRSVVRTARVVLEASTGCAIRTLSIQLTRAPADTRDFLVSLEQSDAMLSPSFAQFIVPASAALGTTRAALAY
jgi:hypothetical protein